jgi:Flp pilus assembly protein TadD
MSLIIASGLCKETGFTLFAMPLLMELLGYVKSFELVLRWSGKFALSTIEFTKEGLFGDEGARGFFRVLLTPRRLGSVRIPALLVSTLIVFYARYRHTGGTSLNMSPQDNPISFESSKSARMLSYSFLHGVYMKLLVWPAFLCYDYSMDAIPIVRVATDARLLLPLAAYVGLFASIAASLRNLSPEMRRAALLALAVLVVTFFPASNILFPVGTVVGERLLYTPSVGICLLFTIGLRALWPREVTSAEFTCEHDNGTAAVTLTKPDSATSKRFRPSSSRSIALRLGILQLLVVALGVRTLLRTRVWSSSESLFLHDGHTQQTSSKTQFNLGITHMGKQEWDAAIEALVRCAHADPLSSLPFYRIGQIEILRGRHASAEKWLSAALDKFGASLMVRDEEVFHDLAIALFQNGKQEAAERRLQVALQLNPDFAKGWNNLACCIAARDLSGATRASQRAVMLAPGNPQYLANLALLSRHAGDVAGSNEAWTQALMLYPGMPEPRDCTWEFAPA